ncbi:hypothetical protein CAOG_03223 [Capsaspora owczarzaki ATCC 30864]|uniref:hypothetical protein n=1 Tax=Capsaspora owczarzaki (strain ATCC 30864) TaxID=595528 RepID=UPI0001FE731C|nr:hypothetical protein CAOG_03223 [Capsaspora owczarzaki ATCC 30864]|eukprot:XP_004364062.1 hypothetical protein CAOG_03223 [Capsaspora owczarzaki ATCC 30864]
MATHIQSDPQEQLRPSAAAGAEQREEHELSQQPDSNQYNDLHNPDNSSSDNLHLRPRDNRHIAQCWLNQGTGYTTRSDAAFTRVLTSDALELEYRRRNNEIKTVIHWGQRKLLLSEIEFLTLHGVPGQLVVYAGAAPGTHLEYLSSLFPELYFHAVDPAPFTAKETDHIKLIQGLFTDEMASSYCGQRALFISDIRSADWQRQSDQEVEASVKWDMDAQMRWHLLMQPVRSMLKFRLPWAPGTTEYLDGDLYLPVWGPITTTEARLITAEDPNAKRDYDHTKYERQMFFFNTEQRVWLYDHPVRGEGLDCCYDCRAEVFILADYLLKVKRVSEADCATEVANMSRRISRKIAGGRTLLDDNIDPGVRKRGIQSRQWIGGRPAYEAANPVQYSARDRSRIER